MTLSSTLALFAAMVVLASIPGPGIFVVVARTLSINLRHGIITSIGIVSGDYVYVFLVISGLSLIAEKFSLVFTVVQYLGVAYITALGIFLFFSRPQLAESQVTGLASKRSSSYMAGLLTTLSNPKAIMFYLGFFPAFVDLNNLQPLDVGIVLLVTTLAVTGVMIAYAVVAHKTRHVMANQTTAVWINRLAGCILLLTALWVLLNGQ